MNGVPLAAGHEVEIRQKVPVTVRGGLTLLTDLYLPRGATAVPAVLYRTPYNTAAAVFARTAFELARAGLAVVLQNCRGRYGSSGDFIPFHGEYEDGFDTVEWMAAQPWFNGDLGLLGASYATYTGTVLVKRGLPAGVTVKAAVSLAGILNPYDAVFLSPSVLTLHWAIPFLAIVDGQKQRSTAEVDWAKILGGFPDSTWGNLIHPGLRHFAESVLGHSTYDSYWEALDTCCTAVAAVPTLHISGWYDFLLPLALRDYQQLTGCLGGRGRHQLLLGPWDHRTILMALARSVLTGPVPGASRYPTLQDGGMDLLAEIRRWLCRWLLEDDPGEPGEAPVRAFIMAGERWEDLADWPPPGATARRWYLHSAGHANSRRGDGKLTPAVPDRAVADSCSHDPNDPVPCHGGALWPVAGLQPGPECQGDIEERTDVLVYTTAPLTTPWTALGPCGAVLWLQTSHALSHVAVKLVDVHPDGRAQIIVDGIQQLKGLLPDAPPALVQVAMAGTGHTFRPGHCIRLEIAPANFPKYATVRHPFRLTVHTGGPYDSRLELSQAPPAGVVGL